MKVEYKNPHVKQMKEDFLYHIGLGTATHNLPEMFGDVKFVCMGGTPNRMEFFANFIMKEIGYKLPPGASLQDISRHSHRYAMFKVGPVLSISHGMGVPSLSILMHEVIKLLAHAGATDPVFFRIGTSGGIGLEGGTVVVSRETIDGRMRPVHETVVLGEQVLRPCVLDEGVTSELVELSESMNFHAVAGKTVCTHDFYEGQGRLDGAFCDYSEADKLDYLRRLNEAGVKNIEMESTAFAALTHAAGVKAAIVCVVLLNRLKGDQISTSKEVMAEWQNRPQKVVAAYIKKHLNLQQKKSEAQAARQKNNLSRFTSYEDQSAMTPTNSICEN